MQYVIVVDVNEPLFLGEHQHGGLADDSIENVCSLLNTAIKNISPVQLDNQFVRENFSVRPLSEILAC